MKHIFIFLFLLHIQLILAQQDIPVIDINKPKSNVASLKMSDLFSDIRYIPLEFNNKYPIGVIFDVAITPEFIFVNCKSTGGQSILKYSLQGKFIEMIGSRGQGPGEYLDGSEMIVDAKNKLMYIRANFSLRMHVYDYVRNKYLYSFPVEVDDRDFRLLDNGNLWCDGNYIIRYTPAYYAWKIMNTKGKVLLKQKSTFFTNSTPSKKPKGIISPNSVLWQSGSDYSVYELQTDLIYRLDMEMNVIPRYKINLDGLDNHRARIGSYEVSKYIILLSYNWDTKIMTTGF